MNVRLASTLLVALGEYHTLYVPAVSPSLPTYEAIVAELWLVVLQTVGTDVNDPDVWLELSTLSYQ